MHDIRRLGDLDRTKRVLEATIDSIALDGRQNKDLVKALKKNYDEFAIAARSHVLQEEFGNAETIIKVLERMPQGFACRVVAGKLTAEDILYCANTNNLNINQLPTKYAIHRYHQNVREVLENDEFLLRTDNNPTDIPMPDFLIKLGPTAVIRGKQNPKGIKLIKGTMAFRDTEIIWDRWRSKMIWCFNDQQIRQMKHLEWFRVINGGADKHPLLVGSIYPTTIYDLKARVLESLRRYGTSVFSQKFGPAYRDFGLVMFQPIMVRENDAIMLGVIYADNNGVDWMVPTHGDQCINVATYQDFRFTDELYCAHGRYR